MRGDGDQGLGQTPRHVLDKSGFAASGRSLQHNGQALGEGGLEHRDLVAYGLIEGFQNDSIGVEVHTHLTDGVWESRPPTRRPPPLQRGRPASPYGRATALERAIRRLGTP